MFMSLDSALRELLLFPFCTENETPIHTAAIFNDRNDESNIHNHQNNEKQEGNLDGIVYENSKG